MLEQIETVLILVVACVSPEVAKEIRETKLRRRIRKLQRRVDHLAGSHHDETARNSRDMVEGDL